MTDLLEKGPQDDFEKIYQALSGAVLGFFLSRISDYEQAVDLTQETFMRLWKILYDNKPVKNVRAFLFTIARNLVIDLYRKKKSVSLESLLVEDSEDKSHLLASDGQIEIVAEAQNLIRKINNLSVTYRQVVYLRCVEGLKLKEIARIIGSSVNVVSVRVSRGLKVLRKSMRYEE